MSFDIRQTVKDKKTLVAAHRGCPGGNIPCNSMEAFKVALNKKADIIELDITKSRDGKLFVFHPGMELPHTGFFRKLSLMSSGKIKNTHFVNPDLAKTNYTVATFDEVLELLKGKCYINIDKFWTAVPEITKAVKAHGMQEQVIVKSDADKKYFKLVEEYASDLNYMVMGRTIDDFSSYLINSKINYLGVECIFEKENMPIASDEYIEDMHRKGLYLWANSIVYNKTDVISAGHTDDISVTGNPDKGWGWLIDKGFDIIQTDWCSELKQYIEMR